MNIYFKVLTGVGLVSAVASAYKLAKMKNAKNIGEVAQAVAPKLVADVQAVIADVAEITTAIENGDKTQEIKKS